MVWQVNQKNVVESLRVYPCVFYDMSTQDHNYTKVRSRKNTLICASMRWQMSLLKEHRSFWADANILRRVCHTCLRCRDCGMLLDEIAVDLGAVAISDTPSGKHIFNCGNAFLCIRLCCDKRTACLHTTHTFHQRAEQAAAHWFARLIVYLL